ncbi:MAG: HpcH/HpaI aldolase/citrate lyase family protein [Proteobacteria bacterium]|nr:HpcH/HpaI aldolase/citrate lyase family protein [Pseudomonadota bacterium]MBS0492424.1 HpcH/HpaI aldolase/citrate lyase family protein [Pseudomonadota bacterium]
MQMPLNAFKRALARGETQIGLFLGLGHGYGAELLGGSGFDWLLIDGEHGPNDLRSIIAQMQALAPYPERLVVRTADHSPAAIKQLLDGGAQTLMVPMVESAEQAHALVRAMRYAPQGIRGVGTAMARAAHWNGVTDYFAQADAEMCLIVQIESVQGVAQLDAITRVPGVDAVFIGPSDLAASMGYLGQPGHPDVKAAVEDAIRRIAAAGKAPGVFSADPAMAAHYQQLGARFLLVGVDTLLLRNAAVALAGRFKQAAPAGAAGASY